MEAATNRIGPKSRRTDGDFSKARCKRPRKLGAFANFARRKSACSISFSATGVGLIVNDDDASWIQTQIKYAEANPQEPYAGVGLALKTLLSLGAGDHELPTSFAACRPRFYSICAICSPKAAISSLKSSA